MSSPFQVEDCSSLSPACGCPLLLPRRTSARSRNASAEDVLVSVTVVARSAPSGPGWDTVDALTDTLDFGSVDSDWRLAHWVRVAPALPSDELQLILFCWVDSQ